MLLYFIALLGFGGVIAVAVEDFSEPEAEDFAYPLPWLKTGPAKERMKFAYHRNGMLKTGWEGEPAKALTAAKVEFEAARKLCQNDPRLDYAYGLVLWKHDRRNEAIKQFDAAAHLNEKVPPFLPAAQAGAWGRLLNDQREAGWKHLVAVANALSKSKGDYPTQVQKEDSALFLGRGIEFLNGPGSTVETANEDKRQAVEVEALIPKDLLSEFTRGREQIDKRHVDLKALADRPANEIVAEFQQKKDTFQNQLDEFQAEITRLNTQMDDQANTLKMWLTQQQQQIGQRETVLRKIQPGINAASRTVAETQFPKRYFESREVSVQEPDKDGKSRTTERKEKFEVSEPAEDRRIRLKRLAEAQKTGEALVRQRDTLRVEVEQLKTEKLQSNRSFVKERNAARVERGKHLRSHRELAAQVKRFVQDYESPETLKTQVGQIAPYVPWDPDVEREALLASYRINLPASSVP